jgi:hypothetical protein
MPLTADSGASSSSRFALTSTILFILVVVNKPAGNRG